MINNMENKQQKKTEIKVVSFDWKQQMIITGYYLFEIKIKQTIINNNNNPTITESSIYRRFSEIEWLHDSLIKYNPGSRIPKLPEKSFWCNLSVNNKLELEKRKQQIEAYLNYISTHKYLSLNPSYLNFLSNDFNAAKIKEEKPSGLFSMVYGLTSYIPYLSKSSGSGASSSGKTQAKGSYTEYNNPNSSLNTERENLMRLKTGLDSLIENMTKHIDLNEKKLKALYDFKSRAKELNYSTLDYRTNISDDFEEDQVDEEQAKQNKKLANNLAVIDSVYEKNRKYQNVLESTIIEQLMKYKIELEGLIEIFERKKKEDAVYQSILKGDNQAGGSNSSNKENESQMQKEIIDNLNEQFEYEIDSFKAYRENDIIVILQKFFKDKLEADMDVEELFISK